MASTTPLEIVDDDEFDWEAAVHEIDVACQTTKTSTSLPIEHFNQVTPRTLSSTTDKKPANSRQSTLDKFMGMAGPRPRTENQNSRDQNQYNVEADERMSCVKIDAEAANAWIYPVNYSPRDYQFSITQTALFSNTLAVLPTGLGKTLIAAVVMYNYFRWFPEGKIVFAAPSRPLVMQQLKACHKIVGIPQEWTIDMTGQTSPSIRAGLWKAKRVFFLTPQVLEKDIQSGTCLVKHLVCLVIDEAHRATGNYSYCVAVRELMAVRVQLRILGLTATPGSNKQKVQEIIDNLQISTLEYRNESDHEVLPYVHDRKIKLIEVAMGPDAVEVYNLLLEVIRPIVARLCTIGVLPKRDIQTWSPCALLDSREKFRQARPEDLHHMKCEEVDGYFGVLITLYHIRKSLSNYGIKRAFDMLEEKLQKGFLARFLSRNEVLLKAKFLMQQSLSRGDLSPKLAKMLEVLIDHFKMKDSQNSRVIIFTNLRGSVRDIIDALANIRDIVKPTEFIGQSSGKTLKGQSQKVQQAVLEKFRAGQYNVIVATSIGEEGLDIMEVDLVICFDANVSSLRMIQRMGRTGRNNEGQVVILACEGSELKGYEHKQKKSKTMNKHMRNGGMNSFNFHSSPRMIPHIFKPEVQHVKLAIEQFVPRGKKVKDDNPIQTPMSKAKLTNADTELIKKYFHPSRGNTWRPSLIAFPHFQEFPSRVHEVMHSFRTGMLIDAMEILQGLSFSRNIKDVFVEDEAVSNLCLGVETAEQRDSMKDLQISHDSPENNLLREVSDSGVLPMETSRNKETHCMQDFQGQNPPIHSYLFGSDFVSVDALGRVLVVSVPLLPLVQVSHSKCASASKSGLQNYLKQDSFHFRASLGESKETVQVKGISRAERILQTAVFNGNLSNRGDSTGETPNVVENKMPLLAADESSNDLRDVELSPRLTDFIKSGVVPESPVDDTGILEGKGRDDFMVPDFVSPPKLDNELLLKSSVPNEKAVKGCCASGIDVPASSINDEIRTPVLSVSTSTPRRCITAFPIVEEIGTPLPNLSNNSCSKDWRLSSEDKSESVEQEKKLKRLCKYGDLHRRPPKGKEDIIGPTANMSRSCANTSLDADKRGKGEKKLVKDARAFIEEEAEVSSEDMVSDDEEDEHDNNSYDDSFIDDRINPTASSTQAEASRKDMMAIYRRSLLTQSPMERLPNFFADVSPDSVVPMTHANESGSSAGTTNHRLQTPSIGLESTGRNSTPFKLNPERISSEAMSCTTNGAPRENASKIESRKRKLSFYQAGSIPIHNLEQEFLLHSDAAEKTSSLRDPFEKIEACGDPFDDDEFYQTIDLDAVEEQAAKLLKYKSELSVQNKTRIPQPIFENNGALGSPSFDLGI